MHRLQESCNNCGKQLRAVLAPANKAAMCNLSTSTHTMQLLKHTRMF